MARAGDRHPNLVRHADVLRCGGSLHRARGLLSDTTPHEDPSRLRRRRRSRAGRGVVAPWRPGGRQVRRRPELQGAAPRRRPSRSAGRLGQQQRDADGAPAAVEGQDGDHRRRAERDQAARRAVGRSGRRRDLRQLHPADPRREREGRLQADARTIRRPATTTSSGWPIASGITARRSSSIRPTASSRR